MKEIKVFEDVLFDCKRYQKFLFWYWKQLGMTIRSTEANISEPLLIILAQIFDFGQTVLFHCISKVDNFENFPFYQ